MNKFFAMMVALLATVFATSAFAWDPPPSPAPKSWIADPGHVLSDDAHARLDAKLRVINQSSANEMAALIVTTTDGQAITDIADLTFKSWGVGKKDIDNGVLVVLAMKEHKSHITTGKGVEGDLPDLKCSDVLKAMRPYLQGVNNGGRPDVEGALGYAFDQSSQMIANHKAEVAAAAAKRAASPQSSTSTNSGGCQVAAPGADTSMVPWVLALLGLGLFGWYMSRRASTRAMRRVQEVEAAAEAERLAREARNAERALREAQMSIPTPVVEVPVVPSVSRPVAPSFPVAPVAAVAAVVATEEAPRPHHTAPKKHHHTSHSSSSSSSSSSSDSSSSFNWGGGSSGGGFDSGGFGGGSTGGGGASGDW